MLSHFWSESFWLPGNTTWEDFSNGPGKDRVYADVKDFWFQIPLVIVILALRFLSEKHVFVPLGRYLKICEIKVWAVPPNARLEAEYRKSSKKVNASSLAKQLDLTERQIERWWRLRRRQDKPTTLVKFCEGMWKGCYFLLNVSLGTYGVWGQDWVQDLDKCFEGYPFQGITPEIWWFYMLASAFCISLIITQFRDVRRKDFWLMFTHHIATLCLLYASWATQTFRIGCLILILHDMVDIVLEFARAAKYAKLHRILNCLFVVFVCVWVVTRLVMHPLYILPTVSKYCSLAPVGMLMHKLLMVLYVLSLLWTWYIFKVVKRTIFAGEFPSGDADARSSESADEQTNSSAKEVSGNGTSVPT